LNGHVVHPISICLFVGFHGGGDKKVYSYNKSITALLVDCLGCTQTFASLPLPLLVDCVPQGGAAGELGGVSGVGSGALA